MNIISLVSINMFMSKGILFLLDMDHGIYKNATPDSMRKLFRSGKLKKQLTSGICQDFLQANIAIVHSDYADDFKKFIELNSAPCPLLYQSRNGEVAAPLLAKDSDIRLIFLFRYLNPWVHFFYSKFETIVDKIKCINSCHSL